MVTSTDEAELARQMEKAEAENAEVAGDDEEEEEEEDDDDDDDEGEGKANLENGDKSEGEE